MRLLKYLKEKYYYTAFDEEIYTNPDSKELARIRENVYTLDLSPYVAAILYGNSAIVFSDRIMHSDLIPKLHLNVDKVITIRIEFVSPKAIKVYTSDTMRASKTYGRMERDELEKVVLNHPWIKKFRVEVYRDTRGY